MTAGDKQTRRRWPLLTIYYKYGYLWFLPRWTRRHVVAHTWLQNRECFKNELENDNVVVVRQNMELLLTNECHRSCLRRSLFVIVQRRFLWFSCESHAKWTGARQEQSSEPQRVGETYLMNISTQGKDKATSAFSLLPDFTESQI